MLHRYAIGVSSVLTDIIKSVTSGVSVISSSVTASAEVSGLSLQGDKGPRIGGASNGTGGASSSVFNFSPAGCLMTLSQGSIHFCQQFAQSHSEQNLAPVPVVMREAKTDGETVLVWRCWSEVKTVWLQGLVSLQSHLGGAIAGYNADAKVLLWFFLQQHLVHSEPSKPIVLAVRGVMPTSHCSNLIHECTPKYGCDGWLIRGGDGWSILGGGGWPIPGGDGWGDGWSIPGAVWLIPGGDGWSILGGNGWPFPGGDGWQILRGGGSQEMVDGQSQEVMVCHSQEVMVGQSLEVVVGQSQEVMVGQSQEVVVGKSQEVVVGQSQEVVVGQSQEVMVGKSQEVVFGQSQEVVVGQFQQVMVDQSQKRK
ncbi:AKAP5-like protein [Mya arenaria]|uniref:AKAP5-like protein n=1 Tax=Mya arenaria TaxID=6604 RepID=A0ABY7DW65_MYAAR|nr:AKAP5-like protein [Mya arenaria]